MIILIILIALLVLMDQIRFIIFSDSWKRAYTVCIRYLLGRSILFILGFYSIPHIGFERVSYQPGNIMISNHSSWIDVLYFWTFYSPLFISGFDGKFCEESPLEMLYRIFNVGNLKSADKDGWKTLEDFIGLAKDRKCPIVIFPEGTTTNGRALLKFNVFRDSIPTKIFLIGLIYSKCDFSPTFSVGSPIAHFYNLACQIENKLLVKGSVLQTSSKDLNSEILKGLAALTRQRITNLTLADKLDFFRFYNSKKLK